MSVKGVTMNRLSRRIFTAISLLPIILVLLASCAAASPPAMVQDVGTTSDTFVLDPSQAHTETERFMAWQVYQQFTEVIDTGTPTPCGDGFGDQAQWCVNLQIPEGTKWQDGTLVSPQDMLAALEEEVETHGEVNRDCPNIAPTPTPRPRPRLGIQDGELILAYPVVDECVNATDCLEANLNDFTGPLAKPGSANIGTGPMKYVQQLDDGTYLFKSIQDGQLAAVDFRQPITDTQRICGDDCGNVPPSTPKPTCPTATPTKEK